MNMISVAAAGKLKHFFGFLSILVLVLSFPLQAWAASTAEFTPTLRTAYDKVVAASTGSVYDELKSLDERLQALRTQEKEMDAAIKELHQHNDELLLSIKARSKNLQADKLAGLQKEAEDAKERYKVVYAFQGSLSKQLSVAKKLKNKTLTSSLQFQLDAAKAAVMLAREDKQSKEDRLAKAKAEKSKKLKELQSRLAETDKLKIRIQAEKSSAVQTGKQITAGLKSLSATAKKGNTGQTLASVSSLTAYSSKLLDQKRAITDLEQKVRDVLLQTNEWLPAQ